LAHHLHFPPCVTSPVSLTPPPTINTPMAAAAPPNSDEFLTLADLFAEALLGCTEMAESAEIPSEVPVRPTQPPSRRRREEQSESDTATVFVPVIVQTLIQPVMIEFRLPEGDSGKGEGDPESSPALPAPAIEPELDAPQDAAASKPAPPKESAAVDEPEQFAFAARISQDPQQSNTPEKPQLYHARPMRLAEPEENPERKAAEAPLESRPTSSFSFGAAKAEAVDTPGPAEVAPVSPIEHEPRTEAPKPLTELSVRVTDDRDQKVDVRIQERGGELRVAVRASDNHLAGGLREAMPELVGRLESNGFRTETWHPAAAAHTVAGVAESQQTSAEMRDADPQSRHGASDQQHSQREQRERDQHGRPGWFDEFQGDTGSEFTPGAFRGLIR
jgi:hypothetical protein